MKKIITILLILSLVVSLFPVATYATESTIVDENNIITIDEYEKAIQIECAKYGIDAFVIDYDPNITITKEMLDHAIENAITYAESVCSSQDNTPTMSAAKHYNSSNLLNPLGVMPVTDTYYGTFFVENAYGSAEMRVETNVTKNLANNTIMYVNSTEVYPLGHLVNFEEWETRNVTYTKDSPYDCWVTFLITGFATFSYADPVTGVKTGYRSEERKIVSVDCT